MRKLSENLISRIRELLDEASIPHYVRTNGAGAKTIVYINHEIGEVEYKSIHHNTLLSDLPFDEEGE